MALLKGLARTAGPCRLGLVALVVACTAAEPEAPLPPAGAVSVGGGRYLVPLGSDAETCMTYGMWAADLVVDAAIRWRRTDGEFVFERPEDCVRAEAAETAPRPMATFGQE